MDAVGVGSERELSRYFGHGNTMITNKRQRGNIPFKEAVTLANEKGLSLDWLILGRETDAPRDSKRDHRSADQVYRRAARNPAMAVAEGDADEAQWGAYNRRAQDVLHEVVLGVESALNETQLEMPPSKKADLIATLFEIYASAHAQPSRNHILRLVRSAS